MAIAQGFGLWRRFMRLLCSPSRSQAPPKSRRRFITCQAVPCRDARAGVLLLGKRPALLHALCSIIGEGVLQPIIIVGTLFLFCSREKKERNNNVRPSLTIPALRYAQQPHPLNAQVSYLPCQSSGYQLASSHGLIPIRRVVRCLRCQHVKLPSSVEMKKRVRGTRR